MKVTGGGVHDKPFYRYASHQTQRLDLCQRRQQLSEETISKNGLVRNMVYPVKFPQILHQEQRE